MKNNLFKICLIFIFLLPAVSSAQFYFGKNKVQYTDFDWQVMTTEHFRIYFYSEEEEVSQFAAELAEKSYKALSVKFNHEVKHSIPLIIYSSPGYFSQTNVIPGLLPESVGGFTEFLKGRVVLPFHGSYSDFAHVIRHEIVHVFMLSKLDEVFSYHTQIKFFYPPLWFTEGLAECWSKGWDTEADMVVADMVVNNRFFSIPNMYQIRGTYYMYKMGESICHFIDSTYGSDKIVKLFENWPKGKSFDEVMYLTIGDSLSQVSQKWEYSLKKKHYPSLENSGLPKMESELLSGNGYAVKGVPLRWDNGKGLKDWVVFKANRLGYSGIYMRPIDGTKDDIKTLIKGEQSSDFESLYLLRSGIDASDSGLIVFSSKSKETDVIYIYDLNKGKITHRYEFDELVATRSPRFSSGSKKVVFTGVKKSGFNDIYLLQLEDGSYEQLTDDIYYETDPDFTDDGNSIIYASDATINGKSGYSNIYKKNLKTKRTVQLTFGDFKDQSPDYTEHGIYFSSNRENGFNIFLLDNDGNLTMQSTYVTGAFNPRLSADGSKLIYTGYQNMGYKVYQMDLVNVPQEIDQPEIGLSYTNWQPQKIAGKYSKSSIKYDTDYSFDIAQSSIGYDPVYGSIGGFQLALSDILGNKSIYMLVTNTSEDKDEFLESFNFGLTYINREKRLNWGVGAFHLYDEYYNDFDYYYTERQAGVISLFSYPFSKFHRLDFTTIARYSDKKKIYGTNRREAFLVTHSLSWVYDNSLWEITGPIEGKRYNFTIGTTISIDNKYEYKNFSRMAMVDMRHYFRLGMYSAFANRVFAYTSAGKEPQKIYFGGSWSLRGYDRREYYKSNILFMSNELRFPLIDMLMVGFRFGGLGFRSIRGALFVDAGSAWDDNDDDSHDKLLGSIGFGLRVPLANIVLLRFDWSKRTNFKKIEPTTHFEFFFGWNF
ncbi:MAG: hypothetical protein U9N54_09925 [candidate division Zixibacteria bacterium]|nr:hypothetical protein [candidate division Zixibacteria bacterium]